MQSIRTNLQVNLHNNKEIKTYKVIVSYNLQESNIGDTCPRLRNKSPKRIHPWPFLAHFEITQSLVATVSFKYVRTS